MTTQANAPEIADVQNDNPNPAAPHMARCLRDFKYAARKRGVDVNIRACSGVSDYSDADWFDPASTQSRTRSRRVWDVWEFLMLRILPMPVYKRISIRPR
jgi:hypothetical protein